MTREINLAKDPGGAQGGRVEPGAAVSLADVRGWSLSSRALVPVGTAGAGGASAKPPSSRAGTHWFEASSAGAGLSDAAVEL